MNAPEKLPILSRDLPGAPLELREEEGVTKISFTASSERPVERWGGEEILSHDKDSIRLDRVRGGSAPLLFNHDWDSAVGMVDGARVVDKKLVVDAHFFDTARAKEIEAMVRGGLRNVSIGYRIHEIVEDRKAETFTATSWEPFEVSIVTVPADPSVGIGRELGGELVAVRMLNASERNEGKPAAPAAYSEVNMTDSNTAAAGAVADKQVDVQVTADFDAVKRDEQRAVRIRQVANDARITDEPTIRHWIASGKGWDQIAEEMLRIQVERSKHTESVAYLGLSAAETQKFSIVKAVRAIVDQNWSKAGFEAEVSRTIANRTGTVLNANTFMVPVDVQMRTLIAGTSSQGGYAVGTDLMSGSFIDMLRNRSVAFRLGARSMTGLVGNVQIPKQATGGSVAWIGEIGTATASELTLGQVTMSPKHVAGFQQISRQLLLQSTPDAEALVSSDLAGALALGLDTAVLAGTSTDSSQPIGIRYTSGLGTANPTAGTAVAYADMIKFQTTVASSNALFDGFGYVCHPAIAGLLMGKPRFTNSDTPIWEGGVLDGVCVGRRAMSSLQITSGTVLGGDFGQVIVGEWGSLAIEVNPFQVFQSGIIGVRGIWSVDVGVRYGAAFAIGTGITG